MLRTKKALKVLTKKEQKHLTDMKITSMKKFLETRKFQIENPGKTGNPGADEPCWDCRVIAGKLEVD